MVPDDLDLAEQLDFLTETLPTAPRRVLDAGSGQWGLARKLLERGYDVTAVDVDEESVSTLRDEGVPAVASEFLNYDGGPFDVVLLSRSLHHMPRLAETVVHAFRLLVPGGRLVVDEFAYDAADPSTAAWFFDQVTLLESAEADGRDPVDGAASEDSWARWNRWHGEEEQLHGGRAMLAEIERVFTVSRVERGSYLFGYLCEWLPASQAGYETVQGLLTLERAYIELGALQPAGLRIVAERAQQ